MHTSIPCFNNKIIIFSNFWLLTQNFKFKMSFQHKSFRFIPRILRFLSLNLNAMCLYSQVYSQELEQKAQEIANSCEFKHKPVNGSEYHILKLFDSRIDSFTNNLKFENSFSSGVVVCWSKLVYKYGGFFKVWSRLEHSHTSLV